jgi:hypothetical protein
VPLEEAGEPERARPEEPEEQRLGAELGEPRGQGLWTGRAAGPGEEAARWEPQTGQAAELAGAPLVGGSMEEEG